MSKQPNIVLIIMDSVRVSNLSCYGYPRKTTPNIDALTMQGTLFEQVISVGCWTLPVHASLFTGLYPLNHGMTVSKDALPEDFPTLARQLKDLNYQTACFSNNAYISNVTGLTQGFDKVEDVWRVVNPRGTKRTKTSKFIKYLERFGPPAKPIIRLVRMFQRIRSIMKHGRHHNDKGARLTNEKIQAWVTESRGDKRPFFLFVNYMETHEPYQPPDPYAMRFISKRFSSRRVAQVSKVKDLILTGDEERRKEDLEIITALYDAELNYLDEKIGELIQSFEKLGILEDTVIIITSDHGDSLGEHNHLGHRLALYEQLVHVPLIIRYPKIFQPGIRVNQQVSLIDLYPTILQLAGEDLAQKSTNGFHSLVTLSKTETHPFTIAENTAPKSLNSITAMMVRTERYKYIWRSDQQHELYDLSKDPTELVNIIAIEPDVSNRLEEQLDAWRRSQEGNQITTSQADYDAVLLERLRDLGYVE